jgi:hypothetical protein
LRWIGRKKLYYAKGAKGIKGTKVGPKGSARWRGRKNTVIVQDVEKEHFRDKSDLDNAASRDRDPPSPIADNAQMKRISSERRT